MIVTEAGEVGVYARGRSYKFVPSLLAMTKLGAPAEIVRVFSSAMTEFEHPSRTGHCIDVLYACCADDVAPLVGSFWLMGHYDEAGAYQPGKMTRLPGLMGEHEIVTIAQHLLKHGVVGDAPPLPRKEGDAPEYVPEFDARGHVAAAIAHLGVSSAEAWNMTMTELVLAFRAKFPPMADNKPANRAPSVEDLDRAMEWFAPIKEKRLQAGK